MVRFKLFFFVLALSVTRGFAQIDLTYQQPPEPIKSLALAPSTPATITSPDGAWLAILDRPEHPSIHDLAQDELRIAGLRINPLNFGPSRTRHYVGIEIVSTNDQSQYRLDELPVDARIEEAVWSPDSKKLAFILKERTGISLYVFNRENEELIQIADGNLNDALGVDTYAWFNDSQHLIYIGLLIDPAPNLLIRLPSPPDRLSRNQLVAKHPQEPIRIF